MNCQIVTDPISYPSSFPGEIDLMQLDPITQSSLHDLSERAFSVGMPYYVFAIATINDNHYALYDAISYRLALYNKIKAMQVDPCTRLPIKRVDYFAITNPRHIKNNALQAISFPFRHFYKVLDETKSENLKPKIENYVFSVLNYHVLESKNKKDVEIWYKAYQIMQILFQLAGAKSQDNEEKRQWTTEQSKWSDIIQN